MQSPAKNEVSHFKNRNTMFVARVRKPTINTSPTNNNTTNTTNKNSTPKNSLKRCFVDAYNYSCFGNNRSQAIYLNERTLSGKFLNSHLLMKEDINNKFLHVNDCDLYHFDHVSNGDIRQKDFYNETAKSLLDYLFTGINSTIIAYGSHQSGKTFVMRGNEKNEIGILPRLAKDIFENLESYQLNLHLSVVKISRKGVTDLLVATKNSSFTPYVDSVSNIYGIRVSDFKEFIYFLSGALSRRDTSNISESERRSSHLCIRLKLVPNDKYFHNIPFEFTENTIYNLYSNSPAQDKYFSRIDLLELADSGFLLDQKKFNPQDIEWLNTSFNGLFDLLVKSYCKGTKDHVINKQTPLNSFLLYKKKLKGKLLFITCLMPSAKDIDRNKESINFANNLRLMIMQKQEKKIYRLKKRSNSRSLSIRSLSNERSHKRSRSSTRGSKRSLSIPASPRKNLFSPTANKLATLDSKLKSIKKNLKSKDINKMDPIEIEEWLAELEIKLLRLENEYAHDSLTSTGHFEKLKEITQIKNELKVARNKAKSHETRLNTNKNINGSSPQKLFSFNTDSLANSAKKSKSTIEPMSPSIKREEGFKSSASGRLNKTPKFEEYNRRLSGSLAKLDHKRETKNSSLRHGYSDEDNDNDIRFTQKLASMLNKKKERSHSRSPTRVKFINSKKGSYGSQDYFMNNHDTSSSSDMSDLDFQKVQQDMNRGYTDLLSNNEKLRSRKVKAFDLLDENEEFIVSRKINNCKVDYLIKMHKDLYNKARDLKQLVEDFSEMNYKLKDNIENLIKKNNDLQRLNKENSKILNNYESEISSLQSSINRKNDIIADFEISLKANDQKFIIMENDISNEIKKNHFLEAKIKEQDELLAEYYRNVHINKDQEVKTIRTYDEKIEQDQRNFADKIVELEKQIYKKDILIRTLEEQKLENNTKLNLSSTDLDILKKKVIIAQKEIDDLRIENKEYQIKIDSNKEIISKMKDKLHELEMNMNLKNEQSEIDKLRQNELKNRLKELETTNIDLKQEIMKLNNDIQLKNKEKSTNDQQEIQALKANNAKLHDEVVRLNMLNASLEDQIDQKSTQLKDHDIHINKANNLEADLAKNIRKYKKIKKLNEQLEQKIITLSSEITKLQASNKELEEELNKLKINEGKHLNHINALELENQELKNNLDSLSSELDQAEKAKMNYKTKLIFAKVDKKKIKEDFNLKENIFREEIANQIKKINAEANKENQTKLKVLI